jgi:hypothetical protein
MRLFHVSEESGIAVFRPRRANRGAWPHLAGRYVWAISDEMVHNFYLPRDCPRVCWTIGPRTSARERAAFAGGQRAIVAVESRWREAIEQCVLHRYELASDSFWPIDYDAGYYVSEREVRPIGVEPLSGLPDVLLRSRVKLEYHHDLEEVRSRIAASRYRFSCIRMANLGIGPPGRPADGLEA